MAWNQDVSAIAAAQKRKTSKKNFKNRRDFVRFQLAGSLGQMICGGCGFG
jgi:hypothetical protein